MGLADTGKVVGGYKKGELACVVAGGAGQRSALKILKAMDYELKMVSISEAQELMGEDLGAEYIIIDDVLCPDDAYKPERKRRGKRKNPNPYQQTMKRGR